MWLCWYLIITLLLYLISRLLHCLVFCCEKPEWQSDLESRWWPLTPGDLESGPACWSSQILPISDLIPTRQVFTEQQSSNEEKKNRLDNCFTPTSKLDSNLSAIWLLNLRWIYSSTGCTGTGISVRFTKFIIFAVGRDYNRFLAELSYHPGHLSTSQLWNEWIQSRPTWTTDNSCSLLRILYFSEATVNAWTFILEG